MLHSRPVITGPRHSGGLTKARIPLQTAVITAIPGQAGYGRTLLLTTKNTATIISPCLPVLHNKRITKCIWAEAIRDYSRKRINSHMPIMSRMQTTVLEVSYSTIHRHLFMGDFCMTIAESIFLQLQS